MERKLQALGYSKKLKLNDVDSWSELVVWLEDQHIRRLESDNRSALRQRSNHQKWLAVFREYLSELNCPFTADSIHEVIHWLLAEAIRLEYSDNLIRYHSVDPPMKSSNGANGTANPNNPLVNLDYKDPAVRKGVATLGAALKIPQHPNTEELLKAVCTVVNKHLTEENMKCQANLSQTKPLKVELSNLDVGFTTDDKNLEHAAKILRMIHINNLRQLQTQINEAIVSVQKVTANPKTDQKLGKVGR